MTTRSLSVEVDRPRRAWFAGRKSNRRAVVQRQATLVLAANALGVMARAVWSLLKVIGKVTIAVGFVVGLVWGSRWAMRHVIDSPRFSLVEVQVAGTQHILRQEVLQLAAVAAGDRLLAIDTDAVAAQVATHPWAASVRVGRRLPGALTIDITERNATGVVALGGLYLLDASGRPFKRATMAETEGFVVITGLERSQYVDMRDATEAAFREAQSIVTEYQSAPARPALSEVNIDMRFGFTLFLFEGGAEIRLGRGDLHKKLAALDQIFEAVRMGGSSDIRTVRIVHLDAADLDKGRVTVKFSSEGDAEPALPRKSVKDPTEI